MKTFYLVRHGESEANQKGILAGWQDYGLTEKGLAQVADTAERLSTYPVEVIISSDLTRAVQTAEAIQQKMHIPLMTEGDLREIFMGDWEGKTFKDLDPESALVKKWLNQEMDFHYPGGESTEDVLNRSYRCFLALLERPESHIAIVGHGMMLSALIAHVVFKEHLLSYGFQLANGGITLLHIDGNFRYLSKLNG